MSGPKTSRYHLTPEQLKRLQEEIERRRQEQIRREKVRKEREKLSIEISNIMTLLSETVQFTDEIKKIGEETKEMLENLEVLLYSEEIDDIKKGIKLIQGKKEIIHSKMLAYVRKQKEMQLEKSFERNQILAKGFEISLEDIKFDIESKKLRYEDLIFNKLEEISIEHLPIELQEKKNLLAKKARTITDEGFLESFYNISILPYVKECKNYCEQYEKYGEQYEELLLEYKALLVDIGGEEREIPFSLSEINILEQLVADMKQQLLDISQEEYISKSIDEAMEEMGYSLAGHREIIKKTGKKFRHELYHFSEGTAINVTYADNGQITMELGAVDNQDRIPTDGEAQKLTEDMEDFCGEYSSLEEILNRKGIVRKNIQVLPASIEYAQVINVSEYDMKENLEKFHDQKKRKNRDKEKYIQ